jgi:osmotically-inducible protein OsmY
MTRRRRLPGAARFLALLLLVSQVGCSALRRPPPVVDRTQDPRIRQEVEARLAREPSLQMETLRVEVDGRVVVLHGSVRGLGAWQCAIRTAQLVEGVQTVADYLVIERGPRDVTCLGTGVTRTVP